MENEYLIIYEQGETGWGAYVPDLPGCVATGTTREIAEERMRTALEWHLEAMRKRGETIPPPTSLAGTMKVA